MAQVQVSKMNTSKQEFLSALLDDEVGAFEQRRVLDELHKDDELSATFNRYALIGEAMRANHSTQRTALGVSLLSRIQDELADEPDYHLEPVVASTPSPVPRRQWQRMGFALAAGVAALAVGGILFLQHPNTAEPMATAQLDNIPSANMAKPMPVNTANALMADPATQARIQQVSRIDPQTRDMLKQYVAQHVKYASTTVIAPSVRAVSYVNEQ